MDRLQYLKERLFRGFHNKLKWWEPDSTIRMDPQTESLPLIQRKAIAFDYVCREMPVCILDRELIVGTSLLISIGLGFGAQFPRYEIEEEAAWAAQYGIGRKSIFGHHLPYYPIVLEKGYLGIMADIEEKLAKAAPQDQKKIEFWTAAKSTLKSAVIVSERYAQLADEMAEKEPDPVRKAELREIARIAEKVPVHPAETFREALQSIWFVHLLLHSTMSMTPLGRLDQILLPYYERDLALGVLTKAQAEELIGCFLIKFNERVQVNKDHIRALMKEYRGNESNRAEYNLGQGVNHWLQSLTVSGTDLYGNDQTNDLSYMFIKLVNELELISPLVNARISKHTPKAFLSFISEQLCRGGAQPALFNDDVIRKGLEEHLHYSPEEACDYGTDGCWEVLIYGRSEISFTHIHLLKVMEGVCNHGMTWMDNLAIGQDLGDVAARFDTYEEFYEAFIGQVRYCMEEQTKRYLEKYPKYHQIAPDPFLSNFVLDCIEKGRDITDQGARYRIFGLLATGLSHCVDSLHAIKKLVYEDRLITLPEYICILKDNWNGHEELRLTALNRVPKYGNNDPDNNLILKRLLDDFSTISEDINESIAWVDVTPGVATFESYAAFGYDTGASFDGRFAREALSSNYSPAVGRDKQGPGAVLLSGTAPDLSRLCMGCPIDMRFHFRKETLEENAMLLESLLESFVEAGGCILTLTKVDLETLKKAQAHPEEYPSLRVRLGGVTTYFVQLARQQQDEYMRRTEQFM